MVDDREVKHADGCKHATYEHFARFLVKHNEYYYWANQTVHCYITKEGALRFWANWRGEETRMYATLKGLLDASHMFPPPLEELDAIDTMA